MYYFFREDTVESKKEAMNNGTDGFLDQSKLGSRKPSTGELICPAVTNGGHTENDEKKKAWIHLTKFELKGLNFLVQWLEQLPPTKKMVPKDITEPDQLLKDMKV